MSLQKDINPKGQRFVHHCLPFSLSLFLSLYLSLSLSLSSSFCLFPHPWNLATQPEGSQVHSEASHVGFSLQPWCRSQQTASVNQYVCKRDKAAVIPAPRLRSSSWDPRHCRVLNTWLLLHLWNWLTLLCPFVLFNSDCMIHIINFDCVVTIYGAL